MKVLRRKDLPCVIVSASELSRCRLLSSKLLHDPPGRHLMEGPDLLTLDKRSVQCSDILMMQTSGII